MLPYYSLPFVTYNMQGMYNPQFQQHPQTMPQYMQQLPMYQASVMPGYTPDMLQDYPQSDYMYDIYDPFNMDNAPATKRPDDPPPILSNNPPTTSITLFKELTGYANYGNPSGNADILYTGNRGTWTFQLPVAFAALDGNLNGQILIRAVLDDHYDVPENRYSANITVNNQRVHTGRVPLAHGRPGGSRFNNWSTLTFNVNNLRRNNRVVIENTSTTGPNDWIAFDWMELRLIPRR